eukprot:CAMPEP_0197639630 /NCGR_PEP_ID=MMETSP1338-20131121/14195_1 /TAXON_ID=43686 ORGANISM="Pelagodinium beii, Strain RCC1491" /NCGR_SAMPLE_ID=MMETSP1338 /ASSEMBLY_ACC=CAM_ASM_000754 /LENGTH=449 /DNA_ID=CAMNT_0043212383 /DNA_START=55 /DNA_END=1400 /DNA_ORIENTATION=-
MDCIPSVGRFFLFTARKRMTESLMTAGTEYPRMFKLPMGPKSMIVATHPELARAILTRPKDFKKGNEEELHKTRITDMLNKTPKGEPANLVSQNGEEWMSQRKPVDPAFEKQALANLVPKFSECSDLLLDSWAGADIIDAKRDMSRFALDVLGTAILGRTFGAIDGSFRETYENYKYVMTELFNPLYMTFSWLEKLPFPRNAKLRESAQHMHDVLEDAVKARLQQRQELLSSGKEIGDPQDMLDMLLGDGVNPSGVLKEGQLVPLLWIFFIAGHDTTAISLTWLMQVMATYPEIQRRAREEAMQIMKGKSSPSAEDLDAIPYISAVISEGLRLRPPVYNLITRETAHDTELDGVSIPKGTGISIHIGAINRHPEVWDRAGEFDPERFMKAKQPRIYNNLPFSAGPRRCLGDKFSLMEQKTLLLKLLSRYEVLPASTAEPANDEYATDFT